MPLVTRILPGVVKRPDSASGRSARVRLGFDVEVQSRDALRVLRRRRRAKAPFDRIGLVGDQRRACLS